MRRSETRQPSLGSYGPAGRPKHREDRPSLRSYPPSPGYGGAGGPAGGSAVGSLRPSRRAMCSVSEGLSFTGLAWEGERMLDNPMDRPRQFAKALLRSELRWAGAPLVQASLVHSNHHPDALQFFHLRFRRPGEDPCRSTASTGATGRRTPSARTRWIFAPFDFGFRASSSGGRWRITRPCRHDPRGSILGQKSSDHFFSNSRRSFLTALYRCDPALTTRFACTEVFFCREMLLEPRVLRVRRGQKGLCENQSRHENTCS